MFYSLAAFPEYMQPLREEVEEVTKSEGWTKAGLDRMYKIDSLIKVSQRLHPLSNRICLTTNLQPTYSNVRLTMYHVKLEIEGIRPPDMWVTKTNPNKHLKRCELFGRDGLYYFR